jgi:hypothetical protein
MHPPVLTHPFTAPHAARSVAANTIVVSEGILLSTRRTGLNHLNHIRERGSPQQHGRCATTHVLYVAVARIPSP